MRNKTLYILIFLLILSSISTFVFHNSKIIIFGKMSKENQIKQALKIAKNNIRIYKNNPKYVIELGNIYEYDKNYDKAVETYREAQKLDPTNTIPIYYIATVQIKNGEFDKALNSLGEIIDINKDTSQAYTYMSLIYLLNDYAKALDYAKLAVDTKPKSDISNYLERYVDYVKIIKEAKADKDKYNAFKKIIADGYLENFDKLRMELVSITDKEFPKLSSLATIK